MQNLTRAEEAHYSRKDFSPDFGGRQPQKFVLHLFWKFQGAVDPAQNKS